MDTIEQEMLVAKVLAKVESLERTNDSDVLNQTLHDAFYSFGLIVCNETQRALLKRQHLPSISI